MTDINTKDDKYLVEITDKDCLLGWGIIFGFGIIGGIIGYLIGSHKK